MLFYRISGLIVAADLTLPGASPLEGSPTAADVTIRRRPVPERLDNPTTINPFWMIAADRFLLTLPGIGRFLAVGGQELDMDPVGNADADALPFLLGAGMGAILHQRGALALHAAAVEWRGRAYVFCGPSGMGKSTLAATLCRDGCRLAADDVSVIGLDAAGRPVAQPDSRMLKLLNNSIERLELAEQRRGAVRPPADKHYVDPPSGALDAPVPLGAIYVLRDAQPPLVPGLERLPAVSAAQALLLDTYRPRLALAHAADGRAMATTAAVLRRTPVFRLARSIGLDRLDQTAAELRAHWAELAEAAG
jgi:hypothetical protein